MTKVPPYLKPGNTIGITCPAGYLAAEKANACVETLQQWGYKVVTGKTVGGSSLNYFSGTDEERRGELQEMLDDKNIHAILFGRGGYGMSRIIDQLNFKSFIKNPKWLIGYSDITVMHSHLISNYNIASMHAPMAAAFNDLENSTLYLDALRDAIAGKKAVYQCEPDSLNRKGDVSGILVGGNLSLLTNIIGTPSDINTKNKLLFIEDLGEYLYNIDRMLYQLKRCGKFDKLAGLIVGGFTDLKDTERPFGKSIKEMIAEVTGEYDFPVCFNFPVSHTKENLALKTGIQYHLKITAKKTTLREIS